MIYSKMNKNDWIPIDPGFRLRRDSVSEVVSLFRF
jgi:hypothetical protein